jgi:hypothetical protein
MTNIWLGNKIKKLITGFEIGVLFHFSFILWRVWMCIYSKCICTWTLDSLHTSHLDFHSQLFIKFFSSVIPSHPGVLIMFLFRVKKFSLPKCTCYTLSLSRYQYEIFASLFFTTFTIQTLFTHESHSSFFSRCGSPFFSSEKRPLYCRCSRTGIKPGLSAVIGARYANNLALHHPYLVMSQAYIL